MTDIPDEPTSPLPDPDAVDPTDARLSAALDGEGDGDVDADATAARGRALVAARDLLAAPPPALDDVTRRRLLDTARSAAIPRRPDRSRWSVPVSVAALIVAVALGGWGLVSVLQNAGTSKANGSKDASQGATMTTGPLRLDSFGEVSTPARLLRQVKAALARRPLPDEARSTAPGSQCRGAVHVPTDVTLEVLAHATFHGAPAVVLVGREAPRTLVYVLASSDCRLLSAQFFTG